jgi:hypothetical protein
LALTTEGCIQLCGGGLDKAQLVDPIAALNIVTTWIFPLAIVLGLPFESLHRAKFRKTGAALLNWLGSPQTSLTATIFNFRQIREAHRRSRSRSGDGQQQTWNDVYYVISCLNQFDLSEMDHKKFIETLVYGLFRPVIKGGAKDKTLLTRDLMSGIAHQLRMLRRRGVVPTMASLGTFLVAFIISVFLTFDQSDSATVEPMVLGLLFSWLPILVAFAIVDRNPVSSERSA